MFKQIIEYLGKRTEGIYKVVRTRVDKTPEGPIIYIEVVIEYGANMVSVLQEYKDKIKKEIQQLTTMNIVDITIVAKDIHIPENKEEE